MQTVSWCVARALRTVFLHCRLAVLGARVAALGALLACAGCSGLSGLFGPQTSVLVGQNAYYAVVRTGENETYDNLAEQWLSSPKKGWRVAAANDDNTEPSVVLPPGMLITVPLFDENPVGVYREGHQVVPILSYHHIDRRDGRLSVSPEQFEQQLDYLRRNGFSVVPLAQLRGFLRGEESIPRRSVVITIDDGYRSAYREAFPILQRFGYPATLFVYTDFLNRGGLKWQELDEMVQSGLVTVEPHSKTHANLTSQLPAESMQGYRARIALEVSSSRNTLEKRLEKTTFSFAYPFGAANQLVVDAVKQNSLALGLTVKRGSNAFFSYPLALKRVMVYGNAFDASRFAAGLRVFEPEGAFLGAGSGLKRSLAQRKQDAEQFATAGDLARARREWRIIDAMTSSREAGKKLAELDELIAQNVVSALNKAQVAVGRGQRSQAIEMLKQALAYDPTSLAAVDLLRTTEAARAHASLAARPVRKTKAPDSTKTKPKTAETSGPTADARKLAERFYRKGVALFSRELDEAIVAFENALSHDPNHKKAKLYITSAKKLKRSGG